MVFLIIGIDQTMKEGFTASYWIFSFSAGFFLWFAYLKRNYDFGEKLAKKYSEKTGKNITSQTKKRKPSVRKTKSIKK
jgi:hypothetical protein